MKIMHVLQKVTVVMILRKLPVSTSVLNLLMKLKET